MSIRGFVEGNGIHGGGPLSKTIEVVAPLTRDTAVLINNAGITGYKQIDAFYVDEINSRISQWAQRMILSPHPIDEREYRRFTQLFPQSFLLKFP